MNLKEVFSENTWAQIVDACKNDCIPKTWVVGDQKPMLIGGVSRAIEVVDKTSYEFQDGTGKAPLSLLCTMDSAITSIQSVVALMPTEVQFGIKETAAWTDSTAFVFYFSGPSGALITDRTQEDVETQTYKGVYQARDLNRVGRKILEIADAFTAVGYAVDVSPKTDWIDKDWPTPATMAHYLEDLKTIRGLINVYNETPGVPASMEKLLYSTANDIERILSSVEDAFGEMKKVFLHTNQPLLFCGYAVYPSNSADSGPGFALYAADGYRVYTADGLPVYLVR